jgi:hypothetical protein
MRKISPIPLILIALLISVTSSFTQPAKIMNAAELELALRKLNVLGSALFVAAHPDDENTAMLSYLSSERLVRTAYLSTTRGDGGQNLIGTEKGDLMGVIRTQELLAARRIDGAEHRNCWRPGELTAPNSFSPAPSILVTPNLPKSRFESGGETTS